MPTSLGQAESSAFRVENWRARDSLLLRSIAEPTRVLFWIERVDLAETLRLAEAGMKPGCRATVEGQTVTSVQLHCWLAQTTAQACTKVFTKLTPSAYTHTSLAYIVQDSLTRSPVEPTRMVARLIRSVSVRLTNEDCRAREGADCPPLRASCWAVIWAAESCRLPCRVELPERSRLKFCPIDRHVLLAKEVKSLI
jgi:hypothetical protein